MKGKFKVQLNKRIHAILTVSLELPQDQKAKADFLDIDEEAQNNLVAQHFQQLIALLGNSDEA